MEFECILYGKEDGIATIKLNRPEVLNAMNKQFWIDFQMALEDARHDPDIALVSQSGNMALTLITEAKLKSRKGFSYYVGVGNESDIRFHEYLEFFRNDQDTKAILMYVEGMRDGRRFLQEAYKTTLYKPIILLKGGRSSIGRRSAGSHTGALAGISEVSRTAFRRAGISVVEKSDELFPVAEALSNLPPIKNKQVAILADGGGHATVAADILIEHLGVDIPELSARTQAKLKKILPFTATVRNPVDVAGGTDDDPSLFAECARILLKDPQVGGLLMVGLFGGYGIRFAASLSLKEEDAAHQLGKLVLQSGKPIVVHSLYTSAKPHALELLRYYHIPVYDSLDVACSCIGALADRGRYLNEYHAKVNFVFNWRAKQKSQGRKIIARAMPAACVSIWPPPRRSARLSARSWQKPNPTIPRRISAGCWSLPWRNWALRLLSEPRLTTSSDPLSCSVWMDLNPVIVYEKGARIVDARIILKD
jgi:acetate---CoA ligase (ADP-forming)